MVSFFFKFIYFQRDSMSGGGQWGRENPKQAPCCLTEPGEELEPTKPWDHDLSQNEESDAQLTEPPRCPMKWYHVLIWISVLLVRSSCTYWSLQFSFMNVCSYPLSSFFFWIVWPFLTNPFYMFWVLILCLLSVNAFFHNVTCLLTLFIINLYYGSLF